MRNRMVHPAPRPGVRLLTWLALPLCWVLVAPPVSRAQDDNEPEFVGIRVGFDNRCVLGAWTPVELLVRGGKRPMTVVAQVRTEDGDGVMSTVVSPRPASLLPGQVTPIRLFVKPGRIDFEFEAALFRVDDDSEDRVARHTFDTRVFPDAMHPAAALQASQQLYVNIGPSVGLEGAVAEPGEALGRESIVVRIDQVEHLPTRWYGYEGVTAVLIPTSRPEVLRALTATSAQLAALDQWVRLGGTLLVSVGSAAPEILGPESPLARFAPGRFAGLAPLRQLRELESYAGATTPLSIPIATLPAGQQGAAEARLDVPQLADVRGLVEVREGDDLPLVIRRPYGLGEVIFIAVDLDRAPFARWNDRSRLVGKLLRLPPRGEAANANPNLGTAGPMHFDVSGQLSQALDSFVGVKIAPFAVVALLVACYILLIGPVDYLLVKRVFKRMELTWITFPLMVVAVSAGAYFVASWMKGDKLLVNEMQVVDVDLESRLVRGTQWINVFSPAVRRYDVTIAPRLPNGQTAVEPRRLVSWMGKSPIGYGLNQPSGQSLFGRGYDFTPDLEAMRGVPIQFWSTKPFFARWDVTEPQVASWFDFDLRRSGEEALDGRIVNRLPLAFDNAILLYKTSVYNLGKIEGAGRSGAAVTIDAGARRDLQNQFRQDGQIGPWSREVTQIMPNMMFQQALGALPELRIVNRQSHFVDLSRLLQMGRAILLVSAADPAISLVLDGQPAPSDDSRRWTYYRFVIPIEATSEEAQP